MCLIAIAGALDRATSTAEFPGAARRATKPRLPPGLRHQTNTAIHRMAPNRRDFLRTTAAVGGAIGMGMIPSIGAAAPAPRRPQPPVQRAQKPLRILILGGTGFIGPHQVRYAQQRGHTVTLFNRGRTNPGLFPDIQKLEGDRAVGNYESLKGKQWDMVI